jgi:hypothetical protein
MSADLDCDGLATHEAAPGAPQSGWVDRDDPRYFDARFFAAPEPGQHWADARIEQLAAIKSRERETITISDNSPEKRAGGAARNYWDRAIGETIGPATPLREDFPNLITVKPYCGDNLADGLAIRARDTAVRKRHIQLNGPAAFQWMIHDIDWPRCRLRACRCKPSRAQRHHGQPRERPCARGVPAGQSGCSS